MNKKTPRLFYYEEACDAWCPAPEKVEDIIDLGSLSDGEEHDSIRFCRKDMTDEEYENIPEE